MRVDTELPLNYSNIINKKQVSKSFITKLILLIFLNETITNLVIEQILKGCNIPVNSINIYVYFALKVRLYWSIKKFYNHFLEETLAVGQPGASD